MTDGRKETESCRGTGGWKEMTSCRADERRVVLVWHVYQQCMVYDAVDALDNRFIVGWMEIPDRWISVAERVPAVTDANRLGVVIVKDTHGVIRLRGWRQARREDGIAWWMPTPEGPENQDELRKAVESA